MSNTKGKIQEDSRLATLGWREVLVVLAKEAGENKIDRIQIANSIAQMTKENSASMAALLEEFIRDPDAWLQGGQANAIMIHQNIVKARVQLATIRDFAILYMCGGKNIQKMANGAKSASKTKVAKSVVKNLNLKTSNNTGGYQTETVAVALGYFMLAFRPLLKDFLPSIDKEAEEGTALDQRYRWVGSIAVYPFGLTAMTIDNDVKFIKDYEAWLDSYIKRRRKDPTAEVPPQALMRKTTQRTFYMTIASVIHIDTKMNWTKGAFAFAEPGEAAVMEPWIAISKKIGFDCYRAAK
jgi:Holliday junction resolvasome RuvABC endonuclease subunit